MASNFSGCVADEIVVMQLDAPALVGGILREHRAVDALLTVLLPSIAAHLAPEHADRIGAHSDRTVTQRSA